MYRFAIFAHIFVAAVVLLRTDSINAAVITPGNSVPGVNGAVFTWSESQANSTFAFWETFTGFTGGTAPGFIPAGTTVSPNSSFANGGSSSTLTFLSNQSITSGGNAYGGLFGPGDGSTFITDAFSTVRSGNSGGNFTRIVAQFQTLGTELDYSSILLSQSVSSAGLVAPSFAIETSRTNAGGAFGGLNVGYLALWDLAGPQGEYRFDFNANSNNASIDQFRIDTFTQNTAFSTPVAAVPEPACLTVIAIVTFVGIVAWLKKYLCAVKPLQIGT